MLVLFDRPPEALDLRYAGVKRFVPPPRGSSRVHLREHDGSLSQRALRAVLDYVDAHLDVGLTLNEMAAVAHLSPYHFARQFKVATALPPHQYVIARRVETAQELLRADDDRSLADIASSVGFSDQSQLSRHFKRVVGVTPRRFRTSARIA